MQQVTNTDPNRVSCKPPIRSPKDFVPNLTRPGGNITGFFGTEFSIGGKWLDLLKQVAPALERVGRHVQPRHIAAS